MPNELKIPEVGESITEVQISEWLKSEGDTVKPDEAVAVIDSEKTTFELPAPMGGKLTKILHQAGDTVRIGEVIAHIEADGETAKAKPAEAKAKPESKPDQPKSEVTPEKPAGKTSQADVPDKEPEADLEKPKEAKVEPGEQKKAEPEERDEKETTQKETQAESKPASETEAKAPEAKSPPSSPPASAPSSADHEEEVVAMTALRRTVARRLVEAQQTMAMLTTFNEVDMSAVQALRREHQEAFEKRHEVRLGLMSFFVKAAIDALKQFPQLNAEVRGTDIVYRNYFDVGVAIATERGLVVPVLRRAEQLSFAEVEQAIGDFAQRAQAGKLKPDELAGGTFTITNGGVFGSLMSTPIINPPQTGILGLHTIQERPVAVNGQVLIRPMMYLALTYDHRLVDGREAVLFLRRVKEIIETPARLLIEV